MTQPMSISRPTRPEPVEPAAVRRTVLHVMPDLQVGGGQTIILQGLRHLDPDRFRTVVAYLDAAGDQMVAAYEAAGAQVVCVDHRPGRGLATVRRLRSLIREHAVDVVQTHSDIDRKFGQLAALGTGVPVVGHLHAEWNHLGSMAEPGDPLVRRVASGLKARVRDTVERRTVVHYVAESTRVKQLFASLVPAPITVLQQALPLETYEEAAHSDARTAVRQELGIPEHAMLLVEVSRLVPGKGQADLLPLVKALAGRKRAVHLLLVGDGPLREDLERAATEHGVTDRVTFAGNRDDIARVLVAADIFVFPSYSEGFGMVALEAMGAGLPVVAYDLPPFHEFMAPGVTSLLRPVGDVGALTAAVASLVDDPERRCAMGESARRSAAERFPSDGVARVLSSVYDRVTNVEGGR